MNMSEYLTAVTEQIRCKRARGMIRQELGSHIEDQKASYIEKGMEPSLAEAEAVRQMGDAISVGMELDRIHRPRLDGKTLTLMAIISLVGLVLQTTVFKLCQLDGQQTGDVGAVSFQILLGVAIMLGILFMDYTLLGKHPLIPWFSVLTVYLLTIADFGIPFNLHLCMQRLCYLGLFGVMLPAYVGIIYHYRKKGFKGLLLSLLWLTLGCFLGHCATGRIFYSLTCFAACFLLLSFAVFKGCFPIPKRRGLAVIWGSLLGGILASCAVILHSDSYQSARLKNIMHKFILLPGNALLAEEDYVSRNIRLNLNNIAFVGKNTSLPQMPQEPSLSFFLLMNEYGNFVGILIVLLLLLLFCFMLHGILKQKNILGSLSGFACLLGIFLPALIHILSNLSLLVYTDMYLPFFYPGYTVNASIYGLIGLYLSVYRYTDVVA